MSRTPRISPPPPDTSLGKRLRALRAARAWTLAELAAASGLARSTLSKIENDLMSPTYDNLLKLADGLGVDVTELFATPQEAMGAGRRSLCRAGEGQLHRTPHYEHALLCTDLAHKRMMPFESRIRARAVAEFEDWSRHAGEEFIYVLDGTIEVHTEFYQPVALGPGDSLYLDSRMGHRVISTSREDARVLWVSTHPQTRAAVQPVPGGEAAADTPPTAGARPS
ncbi:XRE family transcriptional regulator [Plasticicumulans lactativorans]|uniref:XRE family transcriptional regulator n=1 Tax=Plasticicumulans lactativorans TaxID=1133106 RepID=A0A4V2SD57_9GAMM|nr:XRE family transcriptional regulator [Plasticicumulans lactativorans]TCO81996.1 XRE family transcriptional regulator [Plasticicumulans lactativorans]